MKTDTEKLSAAEWTARLDEPVELSHSEKVALTQFLRESPGHVRALIEHRFILEDLRTLSVPQGQLDQWVAQARAAAAGAVPFPEQRAQNETTPQVQEQGSPVERTRWAHLRAALGRKSVIAASLAAVLVAGAVFLHLQMRVYATGFGEQRILTLADGSVVTLNTESRMKVDFSDETRSIELLAGEGFFRVAHDAKRPFLVSAGQAVVQALGTQFNVNMVAARTIVSVVDGVVRVSVENEAGSPRAPDLEDAGGNSQARHEDSQLVLRRGEEARIDRRPPSGGNTLSPMSKVDTPAALHAASWTEGRLEFEGAPLVEVMSQFKRYRELEVYFDSDATRQLKISGSFESRDPDSALAYIATIPGLRVDRKGPQTYFIHRD